MSQPRERMTWAQRHGEGREPRQQLVAHDGPQLIAASDESDDLRWFPLREARAREPEVSLARLFDKALFIRQSIVF